MSKWRWWKIWRWDEPGMHRKLEALFVSGGGCLILERAYAKNKGARSESTHDFHYQWVPIHDYTDGVFWSTPFGITLEIEGKAVARVGFFAHRRYCFISRIQGEKGQSKYLRGWRWDFFLVEAVIGIAKELGCREVRIQEASRNFWYSKRETSSEEIFITDEDEEKHKAILRRRYNETAKSLGFIPSLDGRYWVYSLKTG
jgi:hypothetical protein